MHSSLHKTSHNNLPDSQSDTQHNMKQHGALGLWSSSPRACEQNAAAPCALRELLQLRVVNNLVNC